MDELTLRKLDARIGTVVDLDAVDAAVHAAQRYALASGLIPIAAAVTTPVGDGRHRIDGLGWNRLAEGVPGIHGETGAIRRAGCIDYSRAVVTTSLSPCPFCQRTMAHLGVSQVRILDATNYQPTTEPGLAFHTEIREHQGCINAFRGWLHREENRVLWSRDIGDFDTESSPPVELTRARCESALRIADYRAGQAEGRDAPIGAVVLDAAGEVVGSGCASVFRRGDPSSVAAVDAWRACGGRPHWRDCTLVLTHGPDQIARSMFTVFRFGQLLVGDVRHFRSHFQALEALGIPVHEKPRPEIDVVLDAWLADHPAEAPAYVGATRGQPYHG